MNVQKRIPYERYIGSWVVVRSQNVGVAGKIDEVSDGKMFFLPYQAQLYGDNGRPRYEIIREGLPESMALESIINIQPVTESSVEGNCVVKNLDSLREFLELRSKIESLTLTCEQSSFENGAGI